MLKRDIVVVDPALGISKGHHYGFADMIVGSRPSYATIKFCVHQDMDRSIEKRLQGRNIHVNKIFSQDFYCYYQKSGNVSSCVEYIVKLAKEYIEIFRFLQANTQQYYLIYHTINWEHANALSLALQLSEQQNVNLNHYVLLMFNPGIDHRGRTNSWERRLNFSTALRVLEKQPNVHFFSSCAEYCEAYLKLLNLNEPIPIHPHLFGAVPFEPQRYAKNTNLEHGQLLLFLGDAKVEKGFQRLPALLERCQRECASDASLIVQYSRPPQWERSGLLEVEQQIKRLADQDSRIKLNTSFLPQQKLHELFLSVHLLIMDYDFSAYEEKTSGLIWLAANYAIPVVVPQNTWVAREAKMLGVPFTHWGAEDPLVLVGHRLRQSSEESFNPEYVQQIQLPFWEWMETIISETHKGVVSAAN